MDEIIVLSERAKEAPRASDDRRHRATRVTAAGATVTGAMAVRTRVPGAAEAGAPSGALTRRVVAGALVALGQRRPQGVIYRSSTSRRAASTFRSSSKLRRPIDSPRRAGSTAAVCSARTRVD